MSDLILEGIYRYIANKEEIHCDLFGKFTISKKHRKYFLELCQNIENGIQQSAAEQGIKRKVLTYLPPDMKLNDYTQLQFYVLCSWIENSIEVE